MSLEGTEIAREVLESFRNGGCCWRGSISEFWQHHQKGRWNRSHCKKIRQVDQFLAEGQRCKSRTIEDFEWVWNGIGEIKLSTTWYNQKSNYLKSRSFLQNICRCAGNVNPIRSKCNADSASLITVQVISELSLDI